MAGGAASRSPSSRTAHLPSPEILSCSPWMAHLPSHQRLTLKITPVSSNPSFLDLQDTTCLWVSSYLTIISLPFPAWEAPSLPVALGELWMFLCLIRLVWGSRGTPGRASLCHQNRRGSPDSNGTLCVSNSTLGLYHFTEFSE